MSGTGAVVFAAAVIVIALGVVTVIVVADIRARRDDPPIVHALQPIARPSTHRARILPPQTISHDEPEHRLTVGQAHLEMQRHRSCGRDHCARKEAAYWVLVRAGHIRPATRQARA